MLRSISERSTVSNDWYKIVVKEIILVPDIVSLEPEECMETRVKFNNMDIEVTKLALGTVNFGSYFSDEDSINQIYEYTEMGGNFIDTAHIYGDWEPGDGPRSEVVIGKWLKESGRRNEVVISSKGVHPDMATMDTPRVSVENIISDLDNSLKSLQTDYIDIYFLHMDDRSKPVGPLLECLEEQVKAGKIRYYGVSNWKLDRLMEADEYAMENDLKGFDVNQIMFGLAVCNQETLQKPYLIQMDEKIRKYQEKTGMNGMSYMAMSNGYLPKRFDGLLKENHHILYDTPHNDKVYEILQSACQSSAEITDYCIFFLQDQPFPNVPICSFTSSKQLKEGMHWMESTPDLEILKKLRAISYSES